MKILKKIAKVLGIIIACLIAFGFIIETTLSQLDKKNLNPSGNLIEVNGKNMHLYAVGNGENTIVLIPGHGTTSPYVDFQPLWSRLSKNHRVVVVERFGYGFSDITNRERSMENIIEEMHEALRLSGEKPPYTLVGHSLGGLISIAYSQAYGDEVSNIVMLDSLVPTAYLEFDTGKGMQIQALIGRALNSIGLNRLANMEAVYEVSEMNGYKEVPKELWDTNRYLFLRNYLNKNVRNELQALSEYGNYVSNGNNNYEIPTLFISRPNINFKDKQTEYIKKLKKSQLIELEGGHYLHQYFPNEIEEAIDNFIID